MNKIISFPNSLVIGLIIIYQKTFSPDHGLIKARYPYGFCRHYPTCSQYTKQAFGQFSFFKALFFSIKRLLKCNPWSTPSIDLLPTLAKHCKISH